MRPVKFTKDGRPLYLVGYPFHSKKGVSTMSKTAIDTIVETLASLAPEQKAEVIKRLSASNVAELSAAAAEKDKKARLARIAAHRSDRVPAFNMAEGELKRISISIDDVTDTLTLDKMLASAIVKPTTEKRIEIKSALRACGLIAA
jgi:hypothetical protein